MLMAFAIKPCEMFLRSLGGIFLRYTGVPNSFPQLTLPNYQRRCTGLLEGFLCILGQVVSW
jgi:hypothetical protein